MIGPALALLATLAAADPAEPAPPVHVEEAPPVDEAPWVTPRLPTTEPLWPSRIEVGGVGKFGAGASHYWSVGCPSLGPGLGAQVRYRARLRPSLQVTVDAAVEPSLSSEAGECATFVRYRGALGLRARWLHWGWLEAWSGLEQGIQSLLYLPLPTLTWVNRLGAVPLDWGWLVWDLGLGLDLGTLVIAPSGSVQATTALETRAWGFYGGLEGQVNASFWALGVANGAGAGGRVRLYVGYAFDV